MAFSTTNNNKKSYLAGILFFIVFIFSSPGFVAAQTGTSLPQNFAHTIFCAVNNLLGKYSCGQAIISPNSDLVVDVSFIPIDDELQPQIIQQITQPVIEHTIHTREIIHQVQPKNSSNAKITEATLAQFSSQLDQLSRSLYQNSSSAFDDTALWRAIAQMNVGRVSSGASSDDQSLVFNSGTNILTISGGNSIDLSALSGSAGSDDQTLTAATYNASTKELSISIENGNTVSIDLSDLIDDADASATNEIQSLSLSGDSLSLSGTSTVINLSAYLDDTTLTELQVDAFVSDNGYLTSEVDGSISNEIQDLQLSGNSLTITGNGSATIIDLSPYLDNTDTLSDLNCASNEIAKWNGSAWGCSADASGAGGTDDQTIDSFTLSANIISLSLEGDGEPVKTIDLTAYVNTDTQLNEAQVDSFVSDNGYLTSETDDQTIDAFGFSGDTLTLSLESDGEAAKTVDLSTYAKDSDLHDAITLSGAFDYLTLIGQDIVRGAIDLASDITGTLSIGNGGTGATTTALARSNLGLAIGANVQAFDSGTSLLGQTIETSEISNGTILGADLNLTDITLADFTNDLSFITDGNSSWDNSYGFITSANDTVSGAELDGVFSATGLLTRTGVGTYGTLTDNSANWNTAFGWGDHAIGGYLTGITAQSIKTLSDVHSSMTPTDGQVLTFDTTNGWQAETVSSGADDLGNHIATQTLNLNGNYISGDGGSEGLFVDGAGNVGIGTTTPASLLHLVSASDAAIGLQTNVSFSNSGTETFNNTGSQQTWVVPAGVTSITVDASGARGGSGGNGGRIEVNATTTPGETLYIYVGGSDGFNGGGSVGTVTSGLSGFVGGGASDIRQGGTALNNRIIVAGGGGGKGTTYPFGTVYNGGTGGAGGGFGGGGNGGSGAFVNHGSSGGAGSSGSGAGGAGQGAGAGSGTSGSSGVGGTSGGGGPSHAAGGGGGGGYNGGGGGGGGYGGGGGGGGGGSSYPSTGTHTAGYQSGDGQVIISYSSSTTQDVDWVLGTDQSQAGFFKIAASTALGTSDLLTIDTNGNVGIGTTAPAHPIHMGSGAHVTAGGSWTNASSRDLKENFISLNSMDILNSINTLDISQWNYKAEDASILHIGPIAQDFFAEFGLGGSDVSISTIDTAGVALIGIQALSQKLDNLFAGVSIAEDGTLLVPNIETENIKAKTICLGLTCITEDALRDFLNLDPLTEVSNVQNDPVNNNNPVENIPSEDDVVDSTNPIEETTQEDDAESSDVTATSITPLSEEPNPIEQATSTIEQTVEDPSLDVSEQSSDTSPDDGEVPQEILAEPIENAIEEDVPQVAELVDEENIETVLPDPVVETVTPQDQS